MTHYFIGDLHFGHEKVSTIRGFESTEEHDDHIVEAWLQTVRKEDIVTVMGDISSGTKAKELRALALLDSLPGRKRLMAGNHDSISGVHRVDSPNKAHFYDVFERINDFGRIRLDGKYFLLSHFPYASQGDGPTRGEGRFMEYRLPDTGMHLIHAHTHHNYPFNGSLTGREMCVSWDAWDRLVGVEDLLTWANKEKP